MNSVEIENGIIHIYENDYRLAKVIDVSEKCRLKPQKDYFDSLLKAIVQQQLSIAAASSIYSKFISYFNGKFDPREILLVPDMELRKLGLSNAKVKYVKDLSNKVLSGELILKGISAKKEEEIIKELTVVKGIGVWSSHMFLIFTLGRLNVLPVGDLGIRRAAMNTYNLRKLPNQNKLFQLSKKYNWAPYNSIASWYLWKSLEL
ncbi:MAG: DNA-3-methyladenine glycosylase family protein [Ignavibacteriaceae bacterium]